MSDKVPTEADILKDEIIGLTAQLYHRHGMTERAIRGVVRRALQTGKIRDIEEVEKMRITTQEDLLSDLEEAAVELGNSRHAQIAVGKGIKLMKREGAA